jgi:L-seryl-tRNA(Ser) seleniumtransferase
LREIPFFAMLGASLQDLRERAARYTAALPNVRIVETSAFVGGGALPEHGVPSIAIELKDGAESVAMRLRRNPTPIVIRVEGGRGLLDLRSVLPEQDAEVVGALQNILG